MTMSDKPTPDPQTHSATSTSQSLLNRARNNDAQAWDRLISLYAPLVHYWCRRMRLDEQEIPDVVQEVFKAVATNIERFRGDRPGDTFRGWLHTITRRKVLDYYRHDDRQSHGAGGTAAQHRMHQLIADENHEPYENDDEAVRLRQQLFQRALEHIRANFRTPTWKAFWRVSVDGLSPKEVGDELCMTPGAVRVAKSRVLQRLRRELGELLE